MNIFKKYIYQVIIIFLLGLLIYGHLLNKNSSSSKKNEISIFAQQLKTRNEQISKIQKKLFENGNNINNLINNNEINFKKVFENKKLVDFNGYNFSKNRINEDLFKGYIFSKYTTNDILFNGNLGAIATAYIDFYNEDRNIFLATYDGIFASAEINNLEKFKKIQSNISSIIQYEKFYFHEQYGIKDILIENDNLYVSFIGKRKDECYDLKIITSKLNENFLDFELFYQTLNCVNVNNDHGFWAHQGAGGRIVKLDNSNFLFTTGDFRNRPLAQNIESNFGKILKINTQNKKTDVVSLGHRNPQGLYYSKEFDFILSTEHGPKGGDEININIKPFLKVKNFGWPISSYGDHYAKNYSQKILEQAPLNKSHKKFGFEEPIKYFNPSIGISQVISLNRKDTEFLIGAMGNEIKDQDLGIHYIKLNKDRNKVIDHNYIPLNERVRDMIISKDKKMIIIFLETTSSLAIFKR
tara:strand:- start:30 stop:1433 length:1404 start_codon:yes stop_codon:yes gene_type:complete